MDDRLLLPGVPSRNEERGKEDGGNEKRERKTGESSEGSHASEKKSFS